MDWLSPQGLKLLELTEKCGQLCQFEPSKMAMKLAESNPDQSPQDLHAALDIVLSRRRGDRLGEWASQALLTAQSVEQASRLEVAAHHAKQFRGCKHVLEIGTGAGSDTAAIARVAEKVTSIEASPALAQMARHNLAIQSISNVTVLDGTAEHIIQSLNLSSFDGLWADPSRRDDQGNRIKNAADYRPSLEFVISLAINGPRGIKLSPAYNLAALPQGWTREFLGVAEECIEQTVWSSTDIVDGSLYLADRDISWTPPATPIDADVLPTPEAITGYLVEPHNALIRTGRLSDWFAQNDCKLIDDKVAYGICGHKLAPTPLARSFHILESFEFSLKQIAATLKKRGWTNQTEIKMRGFPQSPEVIRQKLKLPPSTGRDDPSGVVIIARRGDSHLAFIATRERGE